MSEEGVEVSVEPEKEPDFDFLDPKGTNLFRDDSGWLRLEIKDDRCYLDVKVVRAFPLSYADGYLGLLNAKDRVIGLVADLSKLDPTSREVALDDLKRRYFAPVIKKIRRMKEEFGAVYSEVETDLGTRQFVVRGIRDALLDLGDRRLLIIDADGNRFMIEDWARLDGKSRRMLERVV